MQTFFRRGTLAASLFALPSLALVATLPMHAQRYLGSINGQVQDSTGAKVPGAEVTVVESSTRFTTKVTTDGSGTFTLPALNPGTYTVTVTAAGFATETRRGVLLTAGQLQEVDVDLKAGATGEVVEVQAQNALLDNGSPNIATTLSQQEVTDLPNVGRNPFVLATLGVGVTSGAYFQSKASQFTQPFSGVAVQISSEGNAGHNRLTLDGIPDDPPERFSGVTYTGFTPSPEAVQEVKVQTSIFDAQVGHGNGTVTNTVVRNGTNNLHGAAYYVFQNTYLNANTYERVPNQNLPYGGSVAPSRRTNDQLSQTGAVLSGPVVLPKIYNGRDKTFFMVSYERFLSHSALTYNSRVPTQAERAGDFSGLCNTFNAAGLCTAGIQIYDPQSPLDANGNRSAYFANNRIPQSRFDPAGAALMSYYPLPNISGANAQSTLNYISNQTSYRSSYPSFIVRVDQQVGQKDKLNAIFFTAGLTQSYPLQGFPKGIGPTGYGYSVYRNTKGGSLDEVHQFSSTMVLDSRFGLVYHPFGLVYPGSQNFDLGSINIAGGNYPYTSFPGVAMSDSYSGLAAGAGGQISESTTGSLEEILSKTFGRHTVRFGFEGNLLRYNVQNPQSGLGVFNFSRLFTQQNYSIASPTSGDPMAAMLLGAYTNGSYNVTPAYALQQLYMAPFVQDDWRVNNKLTLNLGVRYDYESPFTERYNKMTSGFAFNTPSPLQIPGRTLMGGLTFTNSDNRYQYPRDLNNVQPRIGFAYQATPTTVVRGGYGIIFFNTAEANTSIGTGFSQTTGGATNTNLNTPLTTLSNPFPGGVLLPTGSTLGLATGLGTNISFTDPNHVQPSVTQYVFNVQQQMLGSLVLQVGYVGQQAKHLEVSHDINVLPQQYISTSTDYSTDLQNQTNLNQNVPNPLRGYLPSTANSNLTGTNIARYLLLRPYPQFGSIVENFSPIGASNYNSLQVQVSKPMKRHFSLQGSLTWNKLMANAILNNYGAGSSLLSRIQDPGPTLFGNVFGTVQGPSLSTTPSWARLLLGGWSFNFIMRAQNGSLVSAPGGAVTGGNGSNFNATNGVTQIGSPVLGQNSFGRFFNTCYQNAQGVNVATSSAGPACDAASPTPAFRQRLAFTAQTNNPYLNVRQRIYPLEDASLFKTFTIHEGVSFEIRGEFFNILNRPNFGGPNTSLGSANYGSVYSNVGTQGLTQLNDPRIGQLTGRINF